jgi:hypothetical protein
MKQAFVNFKFSSASLAMIDRIEKILNEYKAMGYRLSLRQLYYQLVARALIENTQQSYKRTGTLVSNARQAGLLDWEMIEDRGREVVTVSHWDSPAQIVEVAARQFRIDKWANQPYYIMAMVEKDALSGVLEPVCRTLDIPIVANKGYSSSSTMYEIGRELYRRASAGQTVTVLYLGDHDPSGIDMTRDIEERLSLYSNLSAGEIEVVRLALNYDQVEDWRPPENPAKTTDSRYAAYEAEYGESSWELDAVEPDTLADLVTQAVEERRDDEQWSDDLRKEKHMRRELQRYAENYESSEHGDLEDDDDFGYEV